MSRVPRPLAFAAFGLLAVGVTPAADTAPAPRPADASVAAPPSGPAALDAAVLAEIKGHSRIMANLEHLSDVIGPRLTGSKNLQRANEWAAEVMKGYGLENVKLEPWELPVGWERGAASMKVIDPDNGRPLLIAARGWTPGTGGKRTGDVLVLKVKTKDDLNAYKGKLKDAVVLLNAPAAVAPIGDLNYTSPAPKKAAKGKGGTAEEPAAKAPPKAGPTAAPTAGKEATGKEPAAKDPTGRPPQPEWYAFRLELNAFLKGEGVACVVADAAKPHGLLVTTGSWAVGDRAATDTAPPSVFMAHEHYAMLHRLATRPAPARTRVEVEISNTFVPGPITVFNTVGEVRGAEKPDEFVVVGAHLDSWDLASGTTDNGTGSCVVLEAARTLAALAAKGQRPKRTVRFVLFSGEEEGLHGSKQYVVRHKAEMPKTSMAVVHDTGTGKVLGLRLMGREAVEKVLAPELEGLKAVGFEGVTTATSGGTDHLSFEDAGVPGFACRQDADEYRLTHHTQSDTFDKAKEVNLIQGAQVMAVTALRVANLPALLPRDKPPAAKK